jgi:hypothetical protein
MGHALLAKSQIVLNATILMVQMMLYVMFVSKIITLILLVDVHHANM